MLTGGIAIFVVPGAQPLSYWMIVTGVLLIVGGIGLTIKGIGDLGS